MTLTVPLPEPTSFRRGSSDSAQVASLLGAAEACFARSGYAGTSLRDIAEVAGVSKSLLHYHFQSKEHLFVEVQIGAYRRLAARVSAAVAEVDSGAERGLLAFDALFAALREKNDLAVQAELWAGALSDPKLRVHVVRLREFFRDLLIATIEHILGDDRHRLPMSAEAAADVVWAMLNGLGIEAAFGDPTDRVERAIATLRLLAGLALDVPRAPARRAASPALPRTTRRRPKR